MRLIKHLTCFYSSERETLLFDVFGELVDRKFFELSFYDVTGAHAAALAALHPGEWDEDTKLSVSAGMGVYSGSKAMAVGAFYRPTDKVMFSIGGSTGSSENMMNLGVTFGLDANPNRPRSSKKEMTQDIVALKAENEVLKDNVDEIKDKLDKLMKILNVKEVDVDNARTAQK